MNKSDWQKLNDILTVAVELEGTGQKSFLEKSCGNDAHLRREVDEMLAAARQAAASDFLAGDAFVIGSDVLLNREKTEGERIGKYKIVRELGRGGMGAVYLAEREDFKQQVALKIIKRGMDTDEIIAHFQREREVLAALNHPNIARLLDGGTTSDGLPFFVMELVEGKTVMEFCDGKKLNIEARLALFRKICKAVSFAHQNLIVHRDIKPSNILITADGEPKLLDFGIAKLLKDDESMQTVTEAGLRMMTPEYASPEQITGEKITTASDIYSLGVLLYELLCGHRPFRLKNRTSPDIIKIISEQKPPAPSTAALATEEIVENQNTKRIISPDTIAERRGEKPARLQRKLFGDLDNIVLTALRKEPARRYATVEQFSEDLRRHLAGLPVTARRNTFGYTAAKFIRRNQMTVVFASLALLAILSGLSVAVWQAVEARRERARAEQRATETRRLANTLLNDFEREFEALPGLHPVRLKMSQIALAYLDNITKETQDPAILKESADAYRRLSHEQAWNTGDTDGARKSSERALELARRAVALAPEDAPAKAVLAEALYHHAFFFGSENRDESLEMIAEAVRRREEILVANPNDDGARLQAARENWEYVFFANLIDRKTEAQPYYLRLRELYGQLIERLRANQNMPQDRLRLASAYYRLGVGIYNYSNDVAAAEENFRASVAATDALLRAQPDFIAAYSTNFFAHESLALVLKSKGDYAGALESYQSAIAATRENIRRQADGRALGEEIHYMMLAADCLQQLGQNEAAINLVRDGLTLHRKRLEAEKGKVIRTLGDRFIEAGSVFAAAGREREALEAFREAEQYKHKILENQPHQVTARFGLARIYMSFGDLYARCAADEARINETNQVRLREAIKWYEKADRINAELKMNFEKVEEKTRTRLIQEKLAACEKKLARS